MHLDHFDVVSAVEEALRKEAEAKAAAAAANGEKGGCDGGPVAEATETSEGADAFGKCVIVWKLCHCVGIAVLYRNSVLVWKL